VPDPAEDLASAKERGWRELSSIDEALERGEIDEEEWHRRVLAIIEPAYLSADTPQAQSGSSRDATGWEQARRLILDAVDRDGSFLDIGCANGLLMESLAEWAGQDGRVLAPYGLEISAALADLARRRLPHWADRVWTGNASTFEAPRRFTYVRTGLDYVPGARRRAYVGRLLGDFVEPGGRLIVGTYNEEVAADTTASALEGWGFRVAGRSSRPHTHPALSYKVLWIEKAA
jgi:SAM-dependent methyltransferase